MDTKAKPFLSLFPLHNTAWQSLLPACSNWREQHANINAVGCLANVIFITPLRLPWHRVLLTNQYTLAPSSHCTHRVVSQTRRIGPSTSKGFINTTQSLLSASTRLFHNVRRNVALLFDSSDREVCCLGLVSSYTRLVTNALSIGRLPQPFSSLPLLSTQECSRFMGSSSIIRCFSSSPQRSIDSQRASWLQPKTWGCCSTRTSVCPSSLSALSIAQSLIQYLVYNYLSQIERGNAKFSKKDDLIWYLMFVGGIIIVGRPIYFTFACFPP